MSSEFIICRKNYLEITGDRCAAELLNFFKTYTPNRKDGWLIITIEELKEKFFDTWGRDAIRKGINLLDTLGLIERDHPRLNRRAWMYKFVTDTLDGICDTSTKTTVVEQPTTVVEQPTTVVEQPTTTIYIDPELDPFLDPQQNQAVVEVEVDEEEEIRLAMQSAPFLQEANQGNNTEFSEEAEFGEESQTNSTQPDNQFLAEIYNEVRSLPINIQLNQNVRGAIRANWQNCKQAIAQIKIAIREWKVRPDFNWTGMFVKACKGGLDIEVPTMNVKIPEQNPPSSADMERIKQLKEERKIRDFYYSQDNCIKVVAADFRHYAWWEFLELEAQS